MPNWGAIFKDLTPAVASIVALLIVIYYLFKALFRQMDINRETSKVIGETNKILEGHRSWIEGLMSAYKDATVRRDK